MSKGILITIISFLAVTYVAAQDAFTPFEGTQKTYQVSNHAGSSYNWAMFTQINPLVAASASATTISGNGNAQVNIQWNQAGDYYLLVNETDALGCTNLKAIRISVLPNNFKLSFASTSGSACYQANNQFTVPLQFLDGNGQPMASTHFPVTVSYQINGVNQPTQIITFTNQNLNISGSSLTASPNSDTPVEITITGASDANNLNILPETNSGQHIHTHTISRQLTAPIVPIQTTNDATPTISGTAIVGPNETFSVLVNGFTYAPGDGNLTLSGTNWALTLPASRALPEGTHEITATVTNAQCNLSDATTNELTIAASPALSDRLVTNDINITFRNIAVSGNVLVNDAGFYAANPTVGMYLEPVNGTVSMTTGGQYTYTPKKDFTGTDNFYYTVCTPENPADCDTANVTVHIVAEVLSQIPPVANDDETQTLQNTAVRGNLLSNDLSVSGEKLILNLKQKQGPKSGTLLLNADGSFIYTPKSGFAGQDYFVYEICGSVSGLCAQARVTITVSNDPEVRLFAADDMVFSYGKTVQGNLLTNDVYPSAGDLSVTRTPVTAAANGTVSINSNGTFTYTPTSGFAGTDRFVYEICDSKLKDCDRATVFILVKETPALFADLSIQKNGPPEAIPGETVDYEVIVTNNGTATATGIQISDYLPSAIQNPKYHVSGSTISKDWPGYYELAQLEITKSISLFISGTVALNATDTLKNLATVTGMTWDPNPGNNISEVETLVRRSGPFARIAGAPYLAVGSCNVQGQILDASLSGGDGLQFAWSPPAFLDNASSSKPVFHPGKTTRYHLTVTDINGEKDTASVLVIVTAAPEAVTENSVFVGSPNETILLNGSQSTGAGLTYLWQSEEGIILNGETTPTAQVSGLGMYYLQVTDSLGCMNKDSVNVGLYIQAINDTAQTKVNESVVINVLKNDIPKSSLNPSSISIVTPPLHGIATIAADSLILYLPEETYIGQDEFVYAICDYFRNCDQAKVLVLINDVPFFIPEAFSPNGDGINDKFEIKGLAKYKTVEIEIFNRWGNVVYRSDNYGEGTGKSGFWDGNAQFGVRVGSGPVPTGTYYYILKLNGKENINGSIYLDR